jgi:kynurenine formamidase
MKPNNALTTIVAMALLWGSWSAFGQQSQGQGQRPAQAAAAGPAMGKSSVTKEQFERWTTELSNWGRWGKDDERGALNLITAEKRKQAAATVKTGTMVSLARNLARTKPAGTPEPRPINRMGGLANLFLMETAPGRDGDYLFERQEIEYHGGELSHFDALCHVAYKGKNYNGFVFKDIVTKDGGCSKLAVTNIKDGIVTRGLLLDLPDTQVRPDDIAAWEKKTGLKISAGDALLLRTKRPGGGASKVRGGYDPAIIPLLKERDVALLGADIAQEGGEIPGVTLPMHYFTLVALGMNLLDNLALDELADTASKLKRWEFQLVIAPLRVQNGAGSAVNPIAIF